MPRCARIVLPGIPHLVVQRGNRRQPAFFSDADCRTYLRLLRETSRAAGTAVWAWCLMPNHVRLILVPKNADGLRAALAGVHRRYTRHVNRREECGGRLWRGRFASFPVDESHLLACARYVELGPVRAGLVASPEDWRWSSVRTHLGLADDAVTQVAPLLGRAGDWRALLDAGLADDESEAIRASERSGRPLGGTLFLRQLAASLGRDVMPRPRGRPRR